MNDDDDDLIQMFRRSAAAPRSNRSRSAKERLRAMREKWATYVSDDQDLLGRRHGCTHQRYVLYRRLNANGSVAYFEGCSWCQFRRPGTPTWLPHEKVDTTKTFVTIDRRATNPPCAVCGAWGTELHHWAPRDLYGIEADHWPTSYLCPPCHQEWRQVVLGHAPPR